MPIRDLAGFRILLVHLNPLQRRMPVPPYGLERVASSARQAGAEVEILDPFLIAEDAAAATVERIERFAPGLIGFGLRVLEDCIPIDGLDDGPAEIDVYSALPPARALCRAVAAAAPGVPRLIGGAGFSAAPLECLDYLELDHGIVGAGEDALVEAARRVCAGVPIAGAAGVVGRGGVVGPGLYQVAAPVVAVEREDLYAPCFAHPVRIRIGCGMTCSYCTAATLLRVKARDEAALVVDELAEFMRRSAPRRYEAAQVFFAADEFNLPDERHGIAILEEVRARGLAADLAWRGYFNPVPFSDRLVDLVKETNGFPSITVDSASDRILAKNHKPFRRRHLDSLVARLLDRGVPFDLGLIFGLPGETEETLAETVAFVRALPEHVEVVYSAGARVYPHTPLAAVAQREPERLVRSDEDIGALAPVVYSALERPRALARRLDGVFADRPNVRPMGVGFRRTPTVLARAYRAFALGAEIDWGAALAEARASHQPDGFTSGLAEIAYWHGRLDEARQAILAMSAEGRPPDVLARIEREIVTRGAAVGEWG